jgi:hypothetical protein
VHVDARRHPAARARPTIDSLAKQIQR